jgi:hypothetical protein
MPQALGVSDVVARTTDAVVAVFRGAACKGLHGCETKGLKLLRGHNYDTRDPVPVEQNVVTYRSGRRGGSPRGVVCHYQR